MKINGSKTYTVVFAGILTVAGMYFQGELALIDAFARVFELLGIAGLRHGVSKK